MEILKQLKMMNITSENGNTKFGNRISVSESNSHSDTGKHEMGYALGMTHSNYGLMKTFYFILLCCFCLTSCHSQTKNKEMKNELNISLLFYPSMSIDNIRYSIDIINDSLIIKKQIIDDKEYRGKLTSNQCMEIKKLTYMLNQKYDRTNNREIVVQDVWGCTLKVGSQIYFADNFFSFVPQSKTMGWQAPPEEIKLLIDYIVSLSPIPIELYGFS